MARVRATENEITGAYKFPLTPGHEAISAPNEYLHLMDWHMLRSQHCCAISLDFSAAMIVFMVRLCESGVTYFCDHYGL